MIKEVNISPPPTAARRLTVVAFHGHPDDEALFTGGTLAQLAAAGHRVVLVVATAGAAGLADPEGGPLPQRRLAELRASADVLGCAAVHCLGFPDSGWVDSGRGQLPVDSFAGMPFHVPVRRLADLLRAEAADVLIVYDRHGGYGHPDHVRVHAAGIAAARLAGVDRIMQVTIDRTQLNRAVRLLGAVRLLPANTAVDRLDSWFADRREITHRLDVRAAAAQKRASLACHISQTEAGRPTGRDRGGRTVTTAPSRSRRARSIRAVARVGTGIFTKGGNRLRTASILLGLPDFLFRRVAGFEWFIELDAPVPPQPLTDFFRSAAAPRPAAVDSGRRAQR